MDFKIACSSEGSFSLVKITIIEETDSGVFENYGKAFDRFKKIAKSGDRLQVIKEFILQDEDKNKYEIQTENGLNYVIKK